MTRIRARNHSPWCGLCMPALLALLSFRALAAQNPCASLLLRTAPSIFILRISDGQGHPLATGTAVAVSAHQVIAPASLLRNAVFVRLAQAGRSTAATPLRCDQARDLCLLQLRRRRSEPLAPPFSNDPPDPGAPLCTEGVLHNEELTAAAQSAGQRYIWNGAPVASLLRSSPETRGALVFSANSEPVFAGLEDTVELSGAVHTVIIPALWIKLFLNPRGTLPIQGSAAAPRLTPAPATPDARRPLTLAGLQRVCVSSFGDSDLGNSAREMVITRLLSIPGLQVLSDCNRAQAALRGFATELRQSRYLDSADATSAHGLSISHHLSHSWTERDLSFEMHLVASSGRIVWADSEQSHGGFTRGPLADAVARACDRLRRAIGKQPHTPISPE